MRSYFFGGAVGGSSSLSLEATCIENIPNNTLVHMYKDGTVLKIRIASRDTDYFANFFIKVGGVSGSKLKCLKNITLPLYDGITVGDIYLGLNGQITNTPPAAGSGLLSQHIGFCDGKTILVDFAQPAVKLITTGV